MKKVYVAILSAALLLSMLSVLPAAAAGDSYTYKRNDDVISEVVYQDFEELDAMKDYSATPIQDELKNNYGFFSFFAGKAMITDQDPISGKQSLMLKDSLDARRWTIDANGQVDADAYVLEVMIRVDALADGSKFAIKLSDLNSKAKDNENSENPIMYIEKNADGTIGLFNYSSKAVATLEAKKAYKIGIVCEIATKNCYLFVDDVYAPDSKTEFTNFATDENDTKADGSEKLPEFSTPGAVRFDITGTAGSIIAVDDIYFDGCELSTGSAGATATAAPTTAPTTAPATTAPVTVAPTATAKPATPTAAPAEDAGFPTWAIIAIAAGVVVIAAVVVVIVVKKKKK